MSAIRHALAVLPELSEMEEAGQAPSSTSTQTIGAVAGAAGAGASAGAWRLTAVVGGGSPADARAHVEALLRAKKLDGTLTSSAPWLREARERDGRLVATGWPAIDRPLGGGFPRGECSEIVGPRSTGRTTVLCALLASAAARGELVALVDPCDRFDPLSASELGVDLDRLLWVRGTAPRAQVRDAREEAKAQTRRLDRAIKAFGLILQAGGFGIVALDLADVPWTALRRLPFTTWRRMQRLLEGHDTAGLLLAAEPLGRSARGVTLRLTRGEGDTHQQWMGESDRARLFAGFTFQPQVHASQRIGA